MEAVTYLLKWCPFEEELLVHATWLNFEERLQSSFCSVEFFVHKFPNILGEMNMDRLNEEFINYQLLSSQDLSSSLCADSSLRVDCLWGYLRGKKEPGTHILAFSELFRVAEVIMTIPHSNAGEEQIFSLINKNKTPSRSSLQIEGTVSSLITHIEDPLKWEPSQAILEKAKHATRDYNTKN